MSDKTHAAMCVYCGEAIIYDTREVTDMAEAHAKIVAHDRVCPKNPLVARIAVLEQERDAMAAHAERESEIILRLVAAMQNYEMDVDSDFPAPYDHRAMMREATAVLADSPTNSLARRDASKRSKGWEDSANELELMECPKTARFFRDSAASHLRFKAGKLRQQSETSKRDNCDLECGAYGTYCKCKAEGHP